MYLYGASGHAKVVIEILEANGVMIDGLVDDNRDLKTLLEYNVYHDINELNDCIISIGNNKIRKDLAGKLNVDRYVTAIHPSAVISQRSQIGNGTVVMQGVIIQSCVSIGNHCIINSGASLDHDCEISDYSHISPHATLCGNVIVEEGAWIGASATVIQGVRVGRWSVVGAGSVVIRDVPAGSVVVGNPAKPIR